MEVGDQDVALEKRRVFVRLCERKLANLDADVSAQERNYPKYIITRKNIEAQLALAREAVDRAQGYT